MPNKVIKEEEPEEYATTVTVNINEDTGVGIRKTKSDISRDNTTAHIRLTDFVSHTLLDQMNTPILR